MVVFAGKFVVLLACFHGLAQLPFVQSALPSYLAASAYLANGLVHLVGEYSHVTGPTISSAQFAMTISPECSALEFVWFIGAVVLSFPSSWKGKVFGLLSAVLFVTAVNVLRAGTLYLVGTHARRVFDFVHEDAWSVLFILLATIFVLCWISAVQRKDPREEGIANVSP